MSISLKKKKNKRNAVIGTPSKRNGIFKKMYYLNENRFSAEIIQPLNITQSFRRSRVNDNEFEYVLDKMYLSLDPSN